MKIINFAWTTPALIAGEKTVCRRDWDSNHAQSFKRGEEVHAYDNRPAYGGKHIATIQLTKKPYTEPLCWIPNEDFWQEGFEYMALHTKVDRWGMSPTERPTDRLRAAIRHFQEIRLSTKPVWVIPFRVIRITQAGRKVRPPQQVTPNPWRKK